MKAKQALNQLLTKPMDRKDFIKHAGVGAAMIFGGGLVVNALGVANGRKGQQVAGYGSSVYGGVKRS